MPELVKYMYCRIKFPLLMIIVTLLAGASGCGQEEPPEVLEPFDMTEWSQWRGPQRDGISRETEFSKNWPENGLQTIWQRPIGTGFSAITIADSLIYTMYSDGEREYLAAMHKDSGQERWRVDAGEHFEDNAGGDGPRATPTIYRNIAYTTGSNGLLLAVDAASGEEVWQVDLVEEYDAKVAIWGYSTSSLVDDRYVYAEVGGNGPAFAAFDRLSGDEVWTSEKGQPGYSSPIFANINGSRQVIFFPAAGLYGLNPENGGFLWKTPWKTSYDVNAATPIFIPPNRIFISTEYDVGAALYQINKSGDEFKAEQLWKIRHMKNKFGSSILHKGHIYGFDARILSCIDADSGELRWKHRGFGEGTVLLADNHLILLSDDGRLAIAPASPLGFNEIASQQVLRGRCWTMPTLQDGRLYLRNLSEMLCLDISEPAS